MKRQTSPGLLTEQTPLLSADEYGPSSASPEDNTPNPPTHNEPLGTHRAVLIILSLCILIFLQGKRSPRIPAL